MGNLGADKSSRAGCYPQTECACMRPTLRGCFSWSLLTKKEWGEVDGCTQRGEEEGKGVIKKKRKI